MPCPRHRKRPDTVLVTPNSRQAIGDPAVRLP